MNLQRQIDEIEMEIGLELMQQCCRFLGFIHSSLIRYQSGIS